ncbi:MAG TPA: Gfo/Idh/MocA family oxidoreductase [Bryobacteraceae bacterium]|nr:Gfo/Idh/MocA family oxidoreductase [Bryobacteraceae bacterium]
MTRRSLTGMLLAAGAAGRAQQPAGDKPVRLVIAGMTHGHVAGFFRRFAGRPEIEVVGITEAQRPVFERYAAEFKLDPKLFFPSLDAALDAAKPEAVMAYSNTFEHKAIVEACARRRVHVMVEKPLAVGMEHARAIERAAKQAGIYVLVNYETTWYPTTQQLPSRLANGIGKLRKIVVRDGHQGPKEIGVPPEFLDWLTDPARNGGGALFDFGCYGANLVTWLMNGRRPSTILASVQTMKPAIYAKVDDDATILLTYPNTQATIQASWNWPFSRKDIDIYGETGYLLAPDRDTFRFRAPGKRDEQVTKLTPLTNDFKDEVSYLAAVVRGRIQPDGLSSLALNMVVTEILDAARRSAREGRSIGL